jgi:hypothetical protein
MSSDDTGHTRKNENTVQDINFIETLSSILTIGNAILIGIKKSITGHAKKQEMPPHMVDEINQGVQTAGQSFLESLNNVNNIEELKQITIETFKNADDFMRGGIGFSSIKNVFKKKTPEDQDKQSKEKKPSILKRFTGSVSNRTKKITTSISNTKQNFTKKIRLFRNVRILKKLLDKITKELGVSKKTVFLKKIIIKKLKPYLHLMRTDDFEELNAILVKYIKKVKTTNMAELFLQAANIGLEFVADLRKTRVGKEYEKQAREKIEEIKKNTIATKNKLTKQATDAVSNVREQAQAFRPSSIPSMSQMGTNLPNRTQVTNFFNNMKSRESTALSDNTTSPDNEEGLTSTAASSVVKNTKNITIGILKKIIMATDFFISNILDFVTQNALNTPLNELTEKSNKRIIALAYYLRQLSQNKEQLDALKEISEISSKIGIDVLDSVKPSIEKIVKKLTDMLEKISSQAAEGAVKSLIGVAGSIIGQIPFLGGIVNLLISIGTGFNTGMRVFRTFTESSGSMAVDGVSAFSKANAVFQHGREEIRKKTDIVKSPNLNQSQSPEGDDNQVPEKSDDITRKSEKTQESPKLIKELEKELIEKKKNLEIAKKEAININKNDVANSKTNKKKTKGFFNKQLVDDSNELTSKKEEIEKINQAIKELDSKIKEDKKNQPGFLKRTFSRTSEPSSSQTRKSWWRPNMPNMPNIGLRHLKPNLTNVPSHIANAMKTVGDFVPSGDFSNIMSGGMHVSRNHHHKMNRTRKRIEHSLDNFINM